MPVLGPWLALFAVPLIAAIILTYLTLRVISRCDQRQPIARDVRIFALERSRPHRRTRRARSRDSALNANFDAEFYTSLRANSEIVGKRACVAHEYFEIATHDRRKRVLFCAYDFGIGVKERRVVGIEIETAETARA